MEFYGLKIQKTDPDTEIYAHLGFLVPVCSGHPDWYKNTFTRVVRSTRSQPHNLHSIWTLGVSARKIHAFLEFLVPIYYGHPIDLKMHSHESFGQHNHNDMTCTQFGLRAFRHGNPCNSRVLARFFSGHLIDPKIILNESLG